MIVQKAKKSKKGLSGAITALILVIASVIIALVVVFFAFGYLGAFSSSPTVTQIGTAYICPSSSGSGGGTLKVTLSSSAPTTIVGVEVGGTSSPCNVALPAGTTSANIDLPSSITFVAGQTYTITLVLSSGATVTVSAVAK
jgi:hypothetical protein